MTDTHPIRHPGPRETLPRLRGAVISVEVLVAFTLLTTLMAVAVPLVVRHGRLLVAARHYRLAVDELSNQLERLTSLPVDQVAAELGNLTPTDFTASHLPGAELNGQWQPADVGGRVVLHIVWDDRPRRAAPLSMAAWVFPPPAATPATGGNGR